MSRKLSLGAAVGLAGISAAVTVSLTYVYAMNQFNRKVADVNQRQAMYAKLSEIDQKVRRDYAGAIDEETLNDGISAGYMAGLNNRSAKYLSAEQYRDYLNAASGKTAGVGARTVRDADGNMEVVQVTPDSPAARSGLRQGDVIVALDGKEVVRLTYGEAADRLDGAAGTKLTLTVLRAPEASGGKPETLDIPVTRAEYTEQTFSSAVVNGNVASFRISRFTQDAAGQFSAALSERVKAGAAGIVMDLRGNSGGSVEAMASVLDALLPAGNTVRSRDRAGKITVEHASGPNAVGLPVSVIVDRETMGAAEIFAADIRDYKKGLLVGEKTAGYGAKEEAAPLSDGSAIVLSVADYLTLNGNPFTGTGIVVDVDKPLSETQRALFQRGRLEPAEDPQMQAAVSALIRQGAAVRQAPGAAEETAGQPGNAAD